MSFAEKIKAYLRRKTSGATVEQMNAVYEKRASFTDLMPWTEYLPESNTMLLEDGVSVGVMFEIETVATEGKTPKYLKDIEENIKSVLTHSIPQSDDPYILQVYVQDQQSLKDFRHEYETYIPEEIRETEFTQAFLKHFNDHLRRVENPKGFFEDTGITGGLWSGKRRRVRAFLYRRVTEENKERKHGPELTEEEKINEVSEKFIAQLKAGGVGIRRCNGEDFWYWMLEWFNPNPKVAEGSTDKLKEMYPYPGDEDLPFGSDFAKSLTITQPHSDADSGCWTFDDKLHRALTIENLIRIPEPGHLTGERKIGENLYAVFDRMPAGTILGFTIVIKPQDTVTNHVTAIKNASKGEEAEAINAMEDAKKALHKMSNGDNLYPVIITAFIRGNDALDIRKNVTAAHSLLLAHGIHGVDERDDQVPMDNYIKMMPMNYEPSREKTVSTSRYMWASHLARLLPFYGRETGTGNPGLVFFNRGAEPLGFRSAEQK